MGFGESWCQPTKYPCPVKCTASQEFCETVNFATDGTIDTVNQKCLSTGETCPCGTNNVKCDVAGEVVCLPPTMAALCPCTAAQSMCIVVDFDASGLPELNPREVCVAKGTTCPC